MVGDDNEKRVAARKKRPPLVTPAQAVQAAYELVAAEGPAGLSMRKLAASLHVSLPTVYTAIRSKDHLIGDIQDRLFIEITDAMNREEGLDPRARLLAMGRMLFAWADRNPHLAEFLLSEDLSVEFGHRAAASAPEPGRNALRQLVVDLIGEDTVNLDPVTSVMFATAVSRALLSLARSGQPVDGEVWLLIWTDTVIDGLRHLADRERAVT